MLVLISCALLPSARAQSASSGAAEAPRFGSFGLDLAGGDPASRPGDDFFRFVNGDWIDKTPMPPDQPHFGVDIMLSREADAQVRALLEDGRATGDPGAAMTAAKLAAFYASFMAADKAEALDLTAVAPELARVRAASSREELAALMGEVNDGYFNSIFAIDVTTDAKLPDRYAVSLAQSGLGLPDRDYYLVSSFAEKKEAYRQFLTTLLTMIQWERPEETARAVLDFETRLAQASWTRAEDRDSEKTYNPMAVAELEALAKFPWRPYLKAAHLGEVERVVVMENTAFPGIAALYAETPIDVLKAWQAVHLVDSASGYLSRRFDDLRYAFRDRTLTGVSDPKPRWRRAVDAANTYLGEAIGRVYVARHFRPQAKAEIDALVALCKVAFRHRIGEVAWMSEETKAHALAKLERLRPEIGYPSRWRDYEALVMRPDDLAGNIRAAMSFEWRRKVARLGLKVDRREWTMTPQTVDAYNDINLNAVFFPAAMLQPPFFDPAADPAVNYGAIGSLIGHEMTHSFDDDGRKYDEEGALSNWWTLADAQEFTRRANLLVRQYDAFELFPGMHVNGELTLGENIADLGGALIALDAYHLSLQGKPAPIIDGFTGDQRFFLSYAQSWRDKATDDEARRRLVSEVHAPEQYRVNGVVRNMDAWYEAFGIKPGDKLYVPPEQRVRIW
jgi:putative endopeptidase